MQGVLSFRYFSLDKQRKVARAQREARENRTGRSFFNVCVEIYIRLDSGSARYAGAGMADGGRNDLCASAMPK